MGSQPYEYWVPYEADLQSALDKLREREFKAGRYQSEGDRPRKVHKPGARHASLEAAVEAGGAEGTRSILDVARIGSDFDFMTAAPLPRAQLRSLFGTEKPTHDQIDAQPPTEASFMAKMTLMQSLERGQCLYVIAYKGGKADEIFFAGMSFD